MIMSLIYLLLDSMQIGIFMWLFGASLVTQLRPTLEAALMAGVLMREAITVSRIPEAPRLENNIKTHEQSTDTDSKPNLTKPVYDTNTMPGKLEQGSALMLFDPYNAGLRRKWFIDRSNVYRAKVMEVYARTSKFNEKGIDEERMEKIRQEVAQKP